jgi:hypothetical protein
MKWRQPRLIELHYPTTITDARDRDNWIKAMMLDGRLAARDQKILTRLAFHLNFKTRRCDPGVGLLAVETNTHGADPERAARRSLAKGETTGWIRRTERHGGDARRTSQTNWYDLTIPDNVLRPTTGHYCPVEQAKRPDKNEANDRTKLQKRPDTIVLQNTESRTLNKNLRFEDLESDEGREGSKEESQPSEARPFLPINPLPPISARPPSPSFRWQKERAEAQATLERYRMAALAKNGGGLATGSSL